MRAAQRLRGAPGGEEFALWLPGADREVAARVAEAVHAHVGAIRLPEDAGAVTVSIGIACRREGERVHPLELIQRADSALYAAKSAGRHRTMWWHAPD